MILQTDISSVTSVPRLSEGNNEQHADHKTPGQALEILLLGRGAAAAVIAIIDIKSHHSRQTNRRHEGGNRNAAIFPYVTRSDGMHAATSVGYRKGSKTYDKSWDGRCAVYGRRSKLQGQTRPDLFVHVRGLAWLGLSDCRDGATVGGCSIIGSPHIKISPGRQFTGKNLPARRPPGRGGLLPVNCRPGETFLGGKRSHNGETFYRTGGILIRGQTYQIRDYISSGGFFVERHFNVTPASERAGNGGDVSADQIASASHRVPEWCSASSVAWDVLTPQFYTDISVLQTPLHGL